MASWPATAESLSFSKPWPKPNLSTTIQLLVTPMVQRPRSRISSGRVAKESARVLKIWVMPTSLGMREVKSEATAGWVQGAVEKH